MKINFLICDDQVKNFHKAKIIKGKILNPCTKDNICQIIININKNLNFT